MIIKRDGDLEDEILLSLRYYFDNEEAMNELNSELQNANMKNIINCYSPNKWAKTYRLVIDDLEIVNIMPSAIIDIHKRLGIKNTDFDFFLGITSAYQTGGFKVPERVAELVRHLEGDIEISYVTYDI